MAYINQKRIAHLRELHIQRVLVDRCTVYPTAGATVDEWGVALDVAPDPREYRGSTEIPCLFYQSRAMENDKLNEQVIVSNRYYVDMPVDFPIDISDVIVDSGGRKFQIRKMAGNSELDISNEMQLGELMNEYDGGL